MEPILDLHEESWRKNLSDMTILHQILKDSTGATAVEYGMLVALMVMAAMVGMTGFANEVGNLWQKVHNGLNSSGVT